MSSKHITVALVGRPSSGKSTFLNTITGKKYSAESPSPQMTRRAIRAVLEAEGGVITFVDAPGLHKGTDPFTRQLERVAHRAISGCDCILQIVDVSRDWGEEEQAVLDFVAKSQIPALVLPNKKDCLKPSELAAELAVLKDRVGEAAIVLPPVCALEEADLASVASALLERAEPGEAAGEAGQTPSSESESEEDFRVRLAEIVREAATAGMRDEIPHAIFVDITALSQNPAGTTVKLVAEICCERDSQKGIIIGKCGANIARIRRDVMEELKWVFPGAKVELGLNVRCVPGWRKNPAIIKRLTGL